MLLSKFSESLFSFPAWGKSSKVTAKRYSKQVISPLLRLDVVCDQHWVFCS